MSIIDWSNLLTISMGAGGDPDKSGNVSTSTNAAGLIWKTMVTVWQSFLERLPLLIAGLIFLALTWVVTYIFNKSAFRILSRFDLKQSQRTLITRLITITIWIVGILISALIIFPDLTPSKALAGLGIGSIAIGFAFKDIFENFFAGLLILWRFPFEPGDYIKCQDVEGEVNDTTIRNTFILRVSGELVVVPNSTIFKNSVDILTYETHRRDMIITGVAYGENVNHAREVILKALEKCSTIDKNKPIQVFACEFADSSINFEVAWWTNPEPLDMRRSRDEVVAAVKAALDEAGVEIPFPYRTVVFKKPVKIDKKEQR